MSALYSEKPSISLGRSSGFRALRVIGLLTMLGLGACAAPKNVFVLLPDKDGTTGAIEIRNSAGTQKISKPNQAIRVADKETKPQAPTTFSDTEIEKEWGEVLRVSPLAPKTFLLYFRTGTDRLTAESEAQFPEIFAEIKNFPAAELSVVGHTDRTGSAASNARLSLKRAKATLRRLTEAGLRHKRVEVDSHGEINPLIPTADGVAEPRNRRVEVTIR